MAHGHHSAASAVDAGPPAHALRAHNEWRVVGLLLPYLSEYKWRVLVALIFLASAKLANVGVPLVLKRSSMRSRRAQQALLAVPLALLVAYGVLRLSTVLFTELRDVVFARATQRAIRRVALTVFRASAQPEPALPPGSPDRRRVARHRARHARHASLLSIMLFSIIPVIWNSAWWRWSC